MSKKNKIESKWKVGEMVIIRWLDSATTPGWKKAGTKPNMSLECKTVGFVIADKPGCFVVAQNWSENDDYGEQMVIPRGCIRRITAVGRIAVDEDGNDILDTACDATSYKDCVCPPVSNE